MEGIYLLPICPLYESMAQAFVIVQKFLDYTKIERLSFRLVGVWIRASEPITVSAAGFPVTIKSTTLETISSLRIPREL